MYKLLWDFKSYSASRGHRYPTIKEGLVYIIPTVL